MFVLGPVCRLLGLLGLPQQLEALGWREPKLIVCRPPLGHDLRPRPQGDPAGLSAKERVDVLDEAAPDRGPVRQANRFEMRRDNLCHRSTYVFVHSKHRPRHIIVQKRTMLKDYCPGFYEPCAGGVLSAGESTADNARRELEEEYGLTAADVALAHCFDFHYKDERVNTWGSCWHGQWATGDRHEDLSRLRTQPEEVECVLWQSADDILWFADQTGEQEFRYTPDAVACLRRYVAELEAGKYDDAVGRAWKLRRSPDRRRED